MLLFYKQLLMNQNTSKYHLEQFYSTFSEVKHRKYDEMIITGAPVELFNFEEVDYWNELTEIMDWTKTNVTSTLHICWGAQAALYYHYGIDKFELPRKCYGLFYHKLYDKTVKLLRGFDDIFLAPHSRYTDVSMQAINECSDLKLLAASDEAGAFIVSSLKENKSWLPGI